MKVCLPSFLPYLFLSEIKLNLNQVKYPFLKEGESYLKGAYHVNKAYSKYRNHVSS